MRTTVISIAIVLMIVSLAFFPTVQYVPTVVPVKAQGTPPAEIVNITDYGEDTNQDFLYEYLVINFSLYVAKAGNYKVYGNLIYQTSSLMITSTTKNLGVGLQDIDLKFSSVPIFNNSIDGQVRVNYSLRFNNVLFLEGDHITSTLNHRDFWAEGNWPETKPQYVPTITKEMQNERYIIKNSNITVWFYYKVPRLEWFFTNDNKSMVKFNCEFEAIHGFVERGAGFDPAAAQYRGELRARGALSTDQMVTGRSRIYGEYVQINVTYSDVPINATSSNRPEKLANITISVMLAAGNRYLNIGTNRPQITIRGGTQLSVNVKVDLRSSLGINGLAIEQEIWAETTKKYYHDISLTDQSFSKIDWDSTDTRLLEYQPGPNEPQQARFQPRRIVELNVWDAYFYWVSRARVDGTYASEIMYYQFEPTKKHLKLFLTVETGATSITSVQTDSLGIGIIEEGAPSNLHIRPQASGEQPSFLITMIGWMTAIVLVILPLYVDVKRAQKRMRELEEEFGEEL